MATIYHVAKDWDGGDLLSLARRLDDGRLTLDEAIGDVAARWTGGDLRKAEEYLDGDGHWVHCHDSLDEAIDFRDEWCSGGVILAIDATDLEVKVGAEYPHPVVRHEVPAWCVSIVGG
jgi:hypothetical protein